MAHTLILKAMEKIRWRLLRVLGITLSLCMAYVWQRSVFRPDFLNEGNTGTLDQEYQERILMIWRNFRN
ncbi:hypothetical protein I7I48_08162 [Histoplasma ohiense]|nr:hypothetical protein I7I48_08162 [Histoplasma ohiense (nom. inval.)]